MTTSPPAHHFSSLTTWCDNVCSTILRYFLRGIVVLAFFGLAGCMARRAVKVVVGRDGMRGERGSGVEKSEGRRTRSGVGVDVQIGRGRVVVKDGRPDVGDACVVM